MGVDRATELRDARELFQRAMREGIGMAEAKARRAAERHAAASARLAARQRCGTEARPDCTCQGGDVQGSGAHLRANDCPKHGVDDADRPLPYYQQGQYA